MHYNQIMTDAVSQPWLAAEQEVERPVIRNVMTIMWCQCINNASMAGFSITNEYISSVRVYMVPMLLTRTCCLKTVEWPVISNIITVMLRYSNNNAIKRDFGITNDYIFNGRVSGLPFLLARTCFWTNSQAAGIWHTMVLICCVTAIAMLSNAISVLQIITSPIREFRCFFSSQPRHAVEQTVKGSVIWDAITLMWRHCKDNAVKHGFSNGRFTHRLARACCSTNSRWGDDWWRHMTLMWRHCKDNAVKRDSPNNKCRHAI